MRSNIYIILALFTGIIYSCKDKADLFEDLTPIRSDKNIVFVEYGLLPANTPPERMKYFSPEFPARDFLPDWLAGKIVNAAAGSTARVSYDFKSVDRPEDLQKLEQDITELGTEDYKSVWGMPFVNALTPAKSPAAELPVLLKAKYPAAVEGDFRIVGYDYSSTEPITTTNTEINYLQEGFSTANAAIDNVGWYNLSTTTGRRWYLRSFSGLVRAIMTANGIWNPDLKMDAWLISKEMDLSQAVDPKFTFDIAVGYFTNHFIKVLISSDYEGGDPRQSTWDDVTGRFNIPREGPESYGTLNSAGEIGLGAYAGKKVHIAFRYEGQLDLEINRSTVYELDNVLVREVGNHTTVQSANRRYDLYRYEGGSWTLADPNSIYVLQGSDYTALNVQNIDMGSAEKVLVPFLRSKFAGATEGMQKTIVYKTGNLRVSADEFTFDGRTWKQSSPKALEVRTDKYVYDGNKWNYENE